MNHFIHDIEISNFKSIRHQKVEGCKRINVFIGYPNVGKSNILEAIGTLGIVEKVLEQKRNPHFLLSDFIRLENLPSCFFQGLVSESPAVIRSNLRTATFEWQDFSGDLLYTCYLDPHLKLSTDFNSELQPVYVSLSDSFISPQNDAKILSMLQGHVYRYSFESSHQKSETRITKAGLQFPFGENIASSIQLIPNLRKEVSEIFSGYGFEMVFENGNVRLLKRTGNDTVFSISLQTTADTLQRLIFYKAAIASNKNSVLLFEEPEAHMFPPYIRKLTWDIISSKSNQFFTATHSPFVLDMLIEEASDELSIYLVDYVDGETKIQLLSDENLKEIREYGVDLFFNIESYLNRGQSHSA
jgi:predicted ATPase